MTILGGEFMIDFIEKFWEVVNEEYDYRDMLTFDEIQRIFDDIKAKKIYKTVEQECSGCGKHFYLKYCSDGNYEYIGEVCDCLATFHPVDGEPSFAEWMEHIKE